MLNGCYPCRFQSSVVTRIFVIIRSLNFPMIPRFMYLALAIVEISFKLLTSAIDSCFKWLISLRISMEFSYKNFDHHLLLSVAEISPRLHFSSSYWWIHVLNGCYP